MRRFIALLLLALGIAGCEPGCVDEVQARPFSRRWSEPLPPRPEADAGFEDDASEDSAVDGSPDTAVDAAPDASAPDADPDSGEEPDAGDIVAPTVSGVDSAKSSGPWPVGEVIDVIVHFGEAVEITGLPRLLLETGTTDRYATYQSGDGSADIVFRYTVQAGDVSSDLDYVGTTSLELNSGDIEDAVGNNATLTLASPGAAGSLGANESIAVDGVAPVVTGVSSNDTNGTFVQGQTITVRVTFSKTVTVNTGGGTPRIGLATTSPSTTNVSYSTGSGSTVLQFAYTVASGNLSADLDYVATNSLSANGGTIKDAAGNDATLTLASPGATDSLGANKALVVEYANIIDSITWLVAYDSKDIVTTAWPEKAGQTTYDLASGGAATLNQSTAGITTLGCIGPARAGKAAVWDGSHGYFDASSTFPAESPGTFHVRLIFKTPATITAATVLMRYRIGGGNNLLEFQYTTSTNLRIRYRVVADSASFLDHNLTVAASTMYLLDVVHDPVGDTGSTSLISVFRNGVDISAKTWNGSQASLTLAPASMAFGLMGTESGASGGGSIWIFEGIRSGTINLATHQAAATACGF